MGKMKDLLLELEEKGIPNESIESYFSERNNQVGKLSPGRAPQSNNQGALAYSTQLEKSAKSIQLTSEEISSARFRKGSPGVD